MEAAGGSVVHRTTWDGKTVIGVADPEGNTYDLVSQPIDGLYGSVAEPE
jgi:hypothetical protein